MEFETVQNPSAQKVQALRQSIESVIKGKREAVELAIVTLPASALERAAHTHGLGVLREFFADRRYQADRSLLSRRDPRAVLHDPAAVVGQVLSAVENGRVAAADGGEVEIAFETICMHGDTPDALELARAVRQALDRAGIPVGPPRAQGPR